MPVSPNNLQFSLSSEYLDLLKEKANPGESLGLTAKRILIAALEAQRESIPSPDLTALTDRISALEREVTTHFDEIETEIDELRDERISALTDRINAIELAIECEHYPEEKVSKRLTALEEKITRLDRIEETIADLQSRINQATSPVKRPPSPPPPRSRKK